MAGASNRRRQVTEAAASDTVKLRDLGEGFEEGVLALQARTL